MWISTRWIQTWWHQPNIIYLKGCLMQPLLNFLFWGGGRWGVFITGPRIFHLNWVTLFWSTMTNSLSMTHSGLCHADSLDFFSCKSVLSLPCRDITHIRKDAKLWLAKSSGRDSVTQSDTEAKTFDVLTKKKKNVDLHFVNKAGGWGIFLETRRNNWTIIFTNEN